MANISVAAFPPPVHQHAQNDMNAGGQAAPPPENTRFDIWTSIQSKKQSTANIDALPPYIHPLLRFSSKLMSQKSLEICTESLGSETGSDGFSSGDELDSYPFFSSNEETGEEKTGEVVDGETGEAKTGEVRRGPKKELLAVNYHCSVGRRSPPRSFPPPLPSISRRDGPCLKMRRIRHDGRLVVEAVPVPSQNYLHAQRRGGRLLLSFIETSSSSPSPSPFQFPEKHETEVEQQHVIEEEDEEEDEEEEEEVEVVDRGTIVEVKVSGFAAVKVHRSSLVINKFVVGSPPTSPESPFPAAKRATAATTAAAAAVAASSISLPTSTSEGFHYNYLHNSPWGPQSPAAAAAADAKLLFASKRLGREDLLHDMRRCSELRRPLFIFEQPHCIATSS